MSLPLEELTLRHLARVIESSDDAIVSKDLNGIIRSWNRAAERMFGYSADEAVGRSIRVIIPADRQDEEDRVLERIRAGDAVTHFETIRRRKDGTLIPISLTVSPIRDDTGQVIGASKIARDISERTQLERSLREQMATTDKLNQVGLVVASTLERDTILQKVTDIARDLTRAEFGAFFFNLRDAESPNAYIPYTLSGTALDRATSFPDPRVTAILTPLFRGAGAIRFDDVMLDPRFADLPRSERLPPRLRMRSCLAVPVKGLSGSLLGSLFFAHAEAAAFTDQHERLAAGISAWAGIALENARLYEEAHTANRMKDEFLAVLSHELRTPLNAIVGYSRLLRGGLLSDDKAARGLETLERNATSLTEIVEDVLDVSRIVSGKIRLDIQPVEMGLIVDNAVASISPAADAKGVRLELFVDPQIGPVSGDASRLQQVVWNLVSNAVKFSRRDGRVQIHVEHANSHVDIVVSDNGAGIRPDFLPYVFERFRQAQAPITRKTGGLGLGLAIVRHIVEMHGGTVEAHSAGTDQGSTFTVRLPLMRTPPHGLEGRQERRLAERPLPLGQLADLHGIRVVAIDDEEDALTLLRVVLETAGAQVTTLRSGVTALEAIETVKPHVLVLDVGMPEIDGFELIRRVRASSRPSVRDVPAAALTAFARSEDRTRALRSGFEMHIPKPVDPGELVASVATLARRGRTAARSRRA
jgi:PAS domain S-box-containing protein